MNETRPRATVDKASMDVYMDEGESIEEYTARVIGAIRWDLFPTAGLGYYIGQLQTAIGTVLSGITTVQELHEQESSSCSSSCSLAVWSFVHDSLTCRQTRCDHCPFSAFFTRPHCQGPMQHHIYTDTTITKHNINIPTVNEHIAHLQGLLDRALEELNDRLGLDQYTD